MTNKITPGTVSAILVLSAVFIVLPALCRFGSWSFAAESRPGLQQQSQVPAIPRPKPCPDLKVALTISKDPSGRVTLNGTVQNIGGADYDIPSEVRCYVTESFIPGSSPQYSYYSVIYSRPFRKVARGGVFRVRVDDQLPDFKAWAKEATKTDVIRGYSLTVAKQDGSTFTSGEDCNTGNNSSSVTVYYKKK